MSEINIIQVFRKNFLLSVFFLCEGKYCFIKNKNMFYSKRGIFCTTIIYFIDMLLKRIKK